MSLPKIHKELQPHIPNIQWKSMEQEKLPYEDYWSNWSSSHHQSTKNLASHGRRRGISPKSTQEVAVMRRDEMEKKGGENVRGDGNEEENMEDLRWNVMEMEVGWVGLRDFEWTLAWPPYFRANGAWREVWGLLESLYRAKKP